MRRPVAVERWRTGGCGKDGGREAVEKTAAGTHWKTLRVSNSPTAATAAGSTYECYARNPKTRKIFRRPWTKVGGRSLQVAADCRIAALFSFF